MPPAGFEPGTPTSDRPQILGLDRSATGIPNRHASNQAAADQRLRRYGYRDRLFVLCVLYVSVIFAVEETWLLSESKVFLITSVTTTQAISQCLRTH